jgi:hypothetical protein
MRPALMSRPKALLGAQANVVWDGNSLCQGLGGTNYYAPANILHTLPMTRDGTFTNCGIGGQAWPDMIATPSDVDNAWVAGKTNVLLMWEHINTLYADRAIYYGDTTVSTQCLVEVRQYIADRRAIHPWIMVMVSSIPVQVVSGDIGFRTEFNRQLRGVDLAIMANPSYYGVDFNIDLRQKGSVFDFPDYTDASFLASGNIWHETAGFVVHLNDAGKAIVANMVEERLRNLRGVPHQ